MPLPKDPIKAEVTRQKMSEASKLKWQDPVFRENSIKKHTDKNQSPETIEKRVLKNIGQRRTPSQICKVCGTEYYPYGKRKGISKFCSKTCKGIQMSKQTGENTPHYCGGNVTKFCEECGKEFSVAKNRTETARFCSQHCKGIWLAKSNLLPKLPRLIGEKNPSWKGGISFDPYCPKFTKEFKERVRAYFGYQCLNCGTPTNGEKLHVHHVNFDKETCCNESIPIFVPLCRSCHGKTQSKRENYQQYFTEIIQTYYQGKCYFSKEEMQSYNCKNQ